jgi:hypothetical protein
MQPRLRQMTPPLRGRTPPASRASRTAGWLTRQTRGLIVASLAALFMSAIGAMGSDVLPFGVRTAYWMAMMITGTLLGLAIMEAASRYDFLENRPLLQGALVTLGLFAPQTLIVAEAGALAFHRKLDAGAVLGVAAPVLIISAVMTTLNYLADRTPRETHAAPEGAGPPRFFERLPLRLRGAEVYAVEAEDHYLRLHTSKGQDLILMRLTDAIAELDGIEGAQTHRSWWVARDGVDAAKRGDGRALLTLKTGAEAPVSRTFARALREAGWF